MSKQLVHDKIDFTTDRDFRGIEVWSDDTDPSTAMYAVPGVFLEVDTQSDDGDAFGRLTASEARILAAMLLRAAERVDEMTRSKKP